MTSLYGLDDDQCIAEILAGLRKPGKSRTGLAMALGKHPNVVTNILNRSRKVKRTEAPIVDAYLELVDDLGEVVDYDFDSWVLKAPMRMARIGR